VVLQLFVLLALQGQEPTEDSQRTLVVAPRAEAHEEQSPAVVTVISGDELRATGERSLPRALGRSSNVWIQETNLGGGAPVVNGLLGNRVLIVVDGVRLNDSTTRSGPNQSLNGIDPSAVERVEIVRGPASLLYGSDAMGGAILIWTRRRAPLAVSADERSWRGALDLEYGSATRGGRTAATISQASENQGWLAVGAFQEYEDLRAGDGETQDFTGYDGLGGFGSWEALVGDRRTLRFVARRTRDEDVPRTDKLTVGFGQTQPTNQLWDFEVQDRASTLLTYTDESGDGFADRMEARLSVRQYKEERRRQRTAAVTRTFERDETDTVGLSVDFQRAVGENQLLTWGLDVDHDTVDSLRVDTDTGTGVSTAVEGAFANDSRYVSSGVFVRDEIFAFEPWTITAGARYSYFDFSFDNFVANGGGREDGQFGALTGALSAARPVSEHANVTVTLAQAFRAPNLDDLANNGNFAGGTEFANPNLDPEESLTAQLSVDTRHEAWGGYAGVFFTHIDELIGRSLLNAGAPPPGDETYMRANVGYANLWGVDAGYDRRLGAEGSPWSGRTVATLVYGKQKGDNVDPNDPTEDEVPFQRVPPVHGLVALRWDEPKQRRWFDWGEVSLVWALDQNRLHPQDKSDPRIDPSGSEGWAVVDVDVGGPLGCERMGGGVSTWTLGVHNLFDTNYRVHASGFDAPGLQLVLGLHVAF
jgi:outer membrane receptor protein involved in Fe transport